jgi:hypothetical protein
MSILSIDVWLPHNLIRTIADRMKLKQPRLTKNPRSEKDDEIRDHEASSRQGHRARAGSGGIGVAGAARSNAVYQ